jgi:hypothetical protein
VPSATIRPGRLLLVIAVSVAGDRVAGYELIGPARLRQVELAILL